MEKPVYGFFVSLFNLFITYIVFANFLGWSGGAISITGYSDVDWSNTYVGFQSLIIATEDFDNVLKGVQSFFGVEYSFKEFLSYLEKLLNVILFGLPKLITKIQSGNVSIFDVGELIFTLLSQPILLLIYVVVVLSYIIVYIYCFSTVFLKFCGGAYNIPLEDSSDIWNQWSYLSSEWEWSNDWSWSLLIPNAI